MYPEAMMGERRFNRDQPIPACAVGFLLRLPERCADANGEGAFTLVHASSLSFVTRRTRVRIA